MKTLIIIDGNAVLHRAFHALPPLTDPDGKIINAVYGFTSMLLKLYADFKPSYLAVAFDRAAPTFRKTLFADYQAKRPKMDDTLIPQIEMAHTLVASMDIPVFEMDGYEADDCIGTIVSNIKNQISNIKNTIERIIIVTGDRDILQLVEEGNVFVYMPTKGISEAKLYGDKEVIERMGVAPKLIPDFKALAGDPSDNYPGVDGIGPKTAVDLLNRFGSVDNLYEALERGKTDGISAGVIAKLTKGKENAYLSLNLATIRSDVPIVVEIPELVTLNTETSRAMFESFGFRTLYKRLTGEEDTRKEPGRNKEEKKKEAKEDAGEQQSLF